MRYIYGLDPASQNDHFGIIVHRLPEKRMQEELPQLQTLRKLRQMPFDEMLEFLYSELFPRYPPYYIVIDYTNERTFTDILIRKYSKRRVKALIFSDTSKKMLKDDGIAILNQGYKFPDDTDRKSKIALWIRDLKEELIHEEMILTPAGKETFSPPQGKHNDLAIAWELSIHGCLKFMFSKPGPHLVVTKKYTTDRFDYLGSGIPPGAVHLGRTVFLP